MTTIATALDEFDRANNADGRAEKTRSWYRWLLADSPHSLPRWVTIAELRVDDVTTPQMREYIVWLRERVHTRTGKPLSVDTISDYIRALHRFFDWTALEYGCTNPMARIKYPTPKRQRQPKAIDLDDLRRLFSACEEDERGIRDKALLAFLIDTGVRAAGICSLRLEDVHLAAHKAIVTEKGSKTRMVVFTGKTAELLGDWYAIRRPEPTVFYSLLRREPLTVNGLRQVIKKLALRAGVSGRVNPHSFRHAFAREYLLAGGDLATLAILMGHVDSSTTTNFYAIFTDQEIFDKHERFSPMARLFAA